MMSGGNGEKPGGSGVQHDGIMEMLNDIQIKMKRQEEESLEVKEHVGRLEQHNEELRETSKVWQDECYRLRTELAELGKNATLSHELDKDSRNPSSSSSVYVWQQETQRLQAQVAQLEQECARLRSQLDKTQSSGGCCCFQLCQLLFGNKSTTGTRTTNDYHGAPQNSTNNPTTTNYYTNHAVRIEN